MALSISVDKARDLTVFMGDGELTFREQMAALHDFYEGTPTSNVIWNFNSLNGNRISQDEIYAIIQYIKGIEHKRPSGKTALVGAKDVDFGISRSAEMYAECKNLPWEIKAFRSMQGALDWIDGKLVVEEPPLLGQ